jgi:hypothetical protein
MNPSWKDYYEKTKALPPRPQRLEKVNEAAVRAWAADKLKIEISGRLSKLVAATDEQQVHVKLKAA